MNVVVCQHDIVWENKNANHLRVQRMLEQAQPAPGSLLVLPEMFATGFSMQAQLITDAKTHETEQFLTQIAQRWDIFVAGGVVTDGQNGLGRNECLVIAPSGEMIARYCKQRPFTLGGEAQFYEAGKAPSLFEWAGFTVAPFICYDLRFPELFRTAVQLGANLFLVIASWPALRIAHWDILLKSRAIENQAYVVGVNRCGSDPALNYVGHSQIIAPSGEVILEAGALETVIQSGVDLADLLKYREKLPFLADMRL